MLYICNIKQTNLKIEIMRKLSELKKVELKQVELKSVKYNKEIFESVDGRLSYRGKYNRKTKQFIITTPLQFRCHQKMVSGNTLVYIYK